MNTTQDSADNTLEAAALLFSIARNESYNFTEVKINANESLRRGLAKRILDKAKSIRPDIDDKTWSNASSELTKRG